MNFLLTGDFTGKFAIPDPKMPILEQETAAPQRFHAQFPKQKNRDIGSGIRELWTENREVKPLYVSSDFLQGPNLVFGTHRAFLTHHEPE